MGSQCGNLDVGEVQGPGCHETKGGTQVELQSERSALECAQWLTPKSKGRDQASPQRKESDFGYAQGFTRMLETIQATCASWSLVRSSRAKGTKKRGRSSPTSSNVASGRSPQMIS